jgi:hypothetical protein
MSDEDLKAENEALKKGASSGIRMKVAKREQSRSTAWDAFP